MGALEGLRSTVWQCRRAAVVAGAQEATVQGGIAFLRLTKEAVLTSGYPPGERLCPRCTAVQPRRRDLHT